MRAAANRRLGHPPGGVVAPDAPGPLLERDQELSRFSQLVGEAAGGSGRIAVIEGTAGIGKSRLLEAVCVRAKEAGLRVLFGRGGELERDLGWRVVRELFEPALVTASESERRALLRGAAGLAAPALGRDNGEAPQLRPDALAAALHGLYWLTVELAGRQPLVLAVDDAHWADIPSLRWLVYLAARVEELPLLVAVTTRPIEPAAKGEQISGTASSALMGVLSGLAAAAGNAPKPSPLSEEASTELVRHVLGPDADPRFCSACHAATGGNPFLLSELARSLARDEVEPVAANADRVLEVEPQTIAHTALLRIARLPAHAQKLATAAAVLGVQTPLRQASELAELDDETVARAAEALAATGILLDRTPLEFVHPIVRAAVYRDLSAARRVQWHRRAARLLRAAGASPDEIAVHLLPLEPDQDQQVVETLLAAAEEALGRGAPDAAVAYLRRVLHEPPPRGREARALQLLGRAETATAGPSGFKTLERAFEASGDAAERAEIALEYAGSIRMTSVFEPGVELLERSLAELEPDSELALNVEGEAINLASGDLSTVDVALKRLNRFTGAADRVKDPGLLADLAALACARARPVAESVDLATRALAAQGQRPNPSVVVYAATALTHADRLDAAYDVWDAFMAEARRQGSALGFGFASIFRSDAAYRQGRVADAEADARAAWNTYRELGAPNPDATAFLIQALLERDLAAAWAVWQATARPDHMTNWGDNPLLFHRGRLRLALGKPQEGLADLLECGRRLGAWELVNPAIIPWRSATAVTLARLGEPQRARGLVEEELSHARRFGTARPQGVALRAAGLVEGGERGTDLLREAVDVLRRSPARLELARVQCDLGASLRRGGRRSDAIKPLREALDGAVRCGAILLAERSRAELVAAGARPRRDLLRGRDALTASELRVAQMAAEGMTNREIAQGLFVSLKTVETHLTHAYKKLDIHARAELQAALSRHQEMTAVDGVEKPGSSM
jgi:DNA-binding CsgD family transcriptional regulator